MGTSSVRCRYQQVAQNEIHSDRSIDKMIPEWSVFHLMHENAANTCKICQRIHCLVEDFRCRKFRDREKAIGCYFAAKDGIVSSDYAEF